MDDHALSEPLVAIGLDDRAIRRVTRTLPTTLLAQWADITLAARERFGVDFFTRSPAAFFMDNVKAAAAGRRTPPDWWLTVRKEEQRRTETDAMRSLGLLPGAESAENSGRQFRDYLQGEGRQIYEELAADIFRKLRSAGRDAHDAQRSARRHARDHLRHQFNRQRRASTTLQSR
jgi:hypothetical protein